MKFKLFKCCLLALSMAGGLHAKTIHYVKPGASGDGSSWANASGDLQGMINSCARYDEVWVTKGTYKPYKYPGKDEVTNVYDRHNAFMMRQDVVIYGGFEGTETILEARNWTVNRTILSGDFSDDDYRIGSGGSLVLGNRDENAYHVVVGVGDLGTAQLDGFTIRGGNADKADSTIIEGNFLDAKFGGGIYLYKTTFFLTNCYVAENSAFSGGGGICNEKSTILTIYNSIFQYNYSEGGAGIFNHASSPYIIRTLIKDNNGYRGAGVFNYGGQIDFTNCIFSGNNALYGGALHSYSSAKTDIMNCTLYGNGTNALYNDNIAGPDTLIINNTLIWGGGTPAAINNDGSGKVIRSYSLIQGMDASGTGNIAGSVDPLIMDMEYFMLSKVSPCTDKGSNALYDGGPRNINSDQDILGNKRLFRGTIDIGANEWQIGQAITPLANQVKYYHDRTFIVTPKASSSLPVTCRSLDERVLILSPASTPGDWDARIVGVGTVLVSMNQSGDTSYAAAPEVSFKVTVLPDTLRIHAEDKKKYYGAADPALTYMIDGGFVRGEGPEVLTGELERQKGEAAGYYHPIMRGTLAAANYHIDYTGAILTINKAPQAISWDQELVAGCSGDVVPLLNASSSIGYKVDYRVSDATVATVKDNKVELIHPGMVTITASQRGDLNHDAAPPVSKTLNYRAANLLRQHWKDVLLVEHMGNDYTQYQWYRNDDAIAGANEFKYSEQPSLAAGTYYVLVTDTSGHSIASCPLSIDPATELNPSMKAYPNPVAAGTPVTLQFNYTEELLKGAWLQITNTQGWILQRIPALKPVMQISLPAASGIYMITLNWPDRKESVSVLVK